MVRDKRGRFVKGQSGNPNGRAPRATEQEYRDALLDIVPIERWKKIVERQAQRAEKGDIRAFESLAKYIVPPIEKRQLDLGDKPIIVRLTND